MKIDLGGGRFPRVGYLNLDKWEKANIICDFKDGLPLCSDTIETIHAGHLLEHIRDLIPLINECWRVLIKEGTMEIFVPKFPHTDSVVDPTHVRFFVPDTFKYFSNDHPLRDIYGIRPWRLITLGESENEVYCLMEPVK